VHEFDLIRQYLQFATVPRQDVMLSIGDDCALLQVPPGQQLAVSMDTLVADRHFISTVDPQSLGHKALAVNLSDLAAMGATPAWVTLSLSLPAANTVWQQWLANFMRGFSTLAHSHHVQLVGGDTTCGPLSMTVQVHGFVAPGQALRRDAAKPGDLIYVSGTLGDAGLALQAQQGQTILSPAEQKRLAQRLDRPLPQVALGQAINHLAHAAIDLSDGLGGDLGHICQASGVGAVIQAAQLPLSALVKQYIQTTADWRLPITAGDDYELAFTVPPDRQAQVQQAAEQVGVPITCIGQITAGHTTQIVLPDGTTQDLQGGYQHF